MVYFHILTGNYRIDIFCDYSFDWLVFVFLDGYVRIFLHSISFLFELFLMQTAVKLDEDDILGDIMEEIDSTTDSSTKVVQRKTALLALKQETAEE